MEIVANDPFKSVLMAINSVWGTEKEHTDKILAHHYTLACGLKFGNKTLLGLVN